MGGIAPLPQGLGVDLGDLRVAVDHEDLPGPGGEVVDPPKQSIPVGVGGKAVEIDDAGLDRNILAKEAHRFDPVQQAAAQGALGLVAHEHHRGLLAPEVVLEVVADASGVAHAGGRNDDLGRGVQVEGLGFLAGLGDVQTGEPEEVAVPQLGNGLLVQIAPQVSGKDFGSGAGQRRVHIDLEIGDGFYHTFLLHLPDEVEELLGASHRKGGDDHVAALAEGLVDDLGQSFGVVAVLVLVEPVAVGALGEDIVGLVNVLGVPDDGLVLVADVARKDDFTGFALFSQPHLGAGRTQQVAGVGKAHLHPGHRLYELAIFAGFQMGEGFFRVSHGIEGLHRGTVGPFALLILPLGVALLNVGRVAEHDGKNLAGQPGTADGTGIALLVEQGNASGVVDVGMGHHDGVDTARKEGKLGVILLVPSLLETAVHQDPFPVAFHAVTAAGNRLRRAEKGQFHGAPPCAFSTMIVPRFSSAVKENNRLFHASAKLLHLLAASFYFHFLYI